MAFLLCGNSSVKISSLSGISLCSSSNALNDVCQKLGIDLPKGASEVTDGMTNMDVVATLQDNSYAFICSFQIYKEGYKFQIDLIESIIRYFLNKIGSLSEDKDIEFCSYIFDDVLKLCDFCKKEGTLEDKETFNSAEEAMKVKLDSIFMFLVSDHLNFM